MQKIKDQILIVLLLFFVLIFSSIPYQVGYKSETNDLVFKGIFYDPQDYAVHLSMMQAGRLGDWAYQFRFTSEDHAPAFIRLFYIFLGHVSRWTNLDVETVFHISRWLFGLTALFAINKLFRKIFPDVTTAHFAFFLAVFGSGIGWLQLLLGVPLKPISPIDFWLIDAYTLFSVSLFPSFSLTLTLMVGGLYFFIDFLEKGQWQSVIWVGLLAVTCQLFNPIAFAVIDASMLGTLVFRWWYQKKIELKHAQVLSIIAIIQLPLLIYNFAILTQDPIWSQFTRQNETLSPPPIFYLWGFFPFWIFAVLGMFKAFQYRNLIFTTMSFWVISGFILAYLPVLIQRRFLLGITIPLGALAIYGVRSFFETLPSTFQLLRKRQNLFQFTYVLLASISSIFLFMNSSLYVLTHPTNLFYSRDLENAAKWLNENAQPNDFILTGVDTSQILAQSTFLKVYVGHEMETLYYDNKESMMKVYFKGTVSNEWLSQTPIQWVMVGPDENKINPSFSPDPHLELAYQNDTIKIYKVTQ